jgi:hypothetical protein
MHIRLTRKLAQALNGFDLRSVNVGDVIDLDDPLAQMLVAERWAEEVVLSATHTRTLADDRRPRRGRRRLGDGPAKPRTR